jgi:hypothetical protein
VIHSRTNPNLMRGELMETRWVKVKVFGDSVPFYASETDESPLTNLSGAPLAEISAAKVTGGRLPTVLSDGRRGYLPSNVNCLQIPLWATASGGTKIYAEPLTVSPVIATLSAGTLLEQYGLKLTAGGDTWIPVRLAGGQTGYVGSGVKVVNHGSQVRIQKTPEDPGEQWLMKDGKLRRRDQRQKTPREAAQRDMLIGGALCVGGILVTVVTYSMVADSGGTYFIMWGPAIFGAYRFVRGMYRYASNG